MTHNKSIIKIVTNLVGKHPKKSQSMSLQKNFYWTFLGNIFYALSQWGILVVIAKIGTPEMLGQFSLGLAITMPVIILSQLQLRAIQSTDAKQEYLFSDYLTLRLIATVFALAIIMGFIFLGDYTRETALIILMTGLYKAIESICDVIYGLLQQYERMDNMAISMILKSLLLMLALCLGLYITHNLSWALFGFSLTMGITLIFYDIPVSIDLFLNTLKREGNIINYHKTQNKYKFLIKMMLSSRPNILLKLTYFALPLGLVLMMFSLNNNIPRLFIEHYLGQKELGIFTAMLYIPMSGNIIISALANSAASRLAKYYVTNEISAFKQLLIKLISISTVLGLSGLIAAIFAGKEIITILYKPEYAEKIDVFVGLMLSGAILYAVSFLGYSMTAARYFKSQLIIYFIVTLITSITSFILIPKYGLQGAVFVLTINSILQLLGCLIAVIHSLSKIQKKI